MSDDVVNTDNKMVSQGLIPIPEFLTASEANLHTPMPRCDFCVQVACETSAMACGQCSGQSCSGQCISAECGQCGSCQRGECGSCQKTTQCNACQSACQETCELIVQKPAATLSLSGGAGTITWTISGLGNPFNNSNYKRVGITMDRFTVGGVSSITGIIDYKNATSSGSGYSVTKTIDYEPGTYNFWGFAETPIGGYWPAGSGTVTVTGKADRPSNWYWQSLVSKGAPIQITYDEWNSFTSRINEFRSYIGYSDYPFTSAYRGMPFYADVMNEARMAIASMGPTASTPIWQDPGNVITAESFNSLAQYLNSVY